MGEAIFALLGVVLEVVLVTTGKAVIAVISFGRWRGERFGRNESRIYGPAGALSFMHEGRRVITSNGLLFVGVISYLLLIFGVVWWAR